MAHFIDTNVVLYAFGAGEKVNISLRLLKDATISVQVLNEFANVAIRKLHYSMEDLASAIRDIRRAAASVAIIDNDTHDLARKINARYKFSFYDSALIASALLTDCDTFYSEDMQDGMVIEGSLTIRNPFV